MKRKPTPKALKAKLDSVFSTFIRQRGMDREGQNVCVSCGALMPWERLQAGHYYRRQHLGTRWDERNVWPQCLACNIWRRGNYASFARFMYGKFSLQELDDLDGLHRETVKLNRADLESMIAKYQGLLVADRRRKAA